MWSRDGLNYTSELVVYNLCMVLGKITEYHPIKIISFNKGPTLVLVAFKDSGHLDVAFNRRVKNKSAP